MTNTADKYITNPMPEGLSRSERRAWVSQVLNPDYIAPEYKMTKADEKLVAAGGLFVTANRPEIVIEISGLGDKIRWSCEAQRFHSTGGTMDREIAKLMNRIGM